MKLNPRTTLWGAILAVLVIFLLVRLGLPPVVLVLMLAVAALAGLVLYSRNRQGDEDEAWDEGDEWGLQTDEDDEVIDLDDRLSGLGLAEPDAPVRDKFAAFDTDEDDEPQYEVFGGVEEETVVLDEEVDASGAAVYGSTDVLEVDELYVEEEISDEDLEGELEELVEEYEYEEAAAAELELEPDAILASEGVIDETKVDSDAAILAASQVSSLKYDDVLQREDANAETREILSRVASLLAKYE